MRKFSVVIAAGAEPIRRHIIDFLKLHPEFEALALALLRLDLQLANGYQLSARCGLQLQQ